MPFTRYKKYYVKDIEQGGWQALSTDETKEPLDYYTSLEKQEEIVTLTEIESVVRSPFVHIYYRYFLLNEDETIREDITSYVQTGVSFDKNNETGQTKSLSITLFNEVVDKLQYELGSYNRVNTVIKQGYRWTPNSNEDILFGYNKIKIVSYMQLQDRVYEKEEGIYYIADPQLQDSDQGHTVGVQLYDKFAMLDGTLQGKDEIDWEIPLGTPIEDAIKSLLKLPRDAKGTPYDDKEVFFPMKHRKILTPYTIKKTGENSVGELIRELGQIISCDVKYNERGNLAVVDMLEDIDYHNRSLAWIYENDDFSNPSFQINRSQLKNKVVVVGGNINGHLVKGIAENTNPDSNYNVNSLFGVRSIKITDDNLSTPTLCEDRAKYELRKYAQNYINLNFTSIYIPHMEPGDVFFWSYDKWNIENEVFMVTSLNIGEDGTMNVSATNVKEMPI